MSDRAPPGYEAFRVGRARVVALASLADAVREALGVGSHSRTLFEYAATHAEAFPLAGRGVAWSAPLPHGAGRVVVRHSRHGGILAPLTGDRFLGATRAPHELMVSIRLRAAGVPTPELLAYAVYPAGPGLARADVATREIAGGRDLASALAQRMSEVERLACVDAAARLLAQLAAVGVRHPDLNAKNILLAPGPDGSPVAHLLDVDRVALGAPGDTRIARANARRLARSTRKLRERGALRIADAELARLVGIGS